MDGSPLPILFAHGADPGAHFLDVRGIAHAIILRSLQLLLHCPPYVLLGLMAAGFLRGMVGEASIRSFFGRGRWSAPFRGWLAGFCLPTCSLGALPVARELLRAGAPRGAVMAFLFSGACLNPLSIIMGLTRIDGGLLLAFVAGSLVISMLAGMAARESDGGDGASAADPALPLAPTGAGRLATAGLHLSRDLAGPMLRDLLIAMAGVAALAAAAPHGFLEEAVAPGHLSSLPAGALACTLAYLNPFEAMGTASTVLTDGFPAGLAWLAIFLGGGMNLGTIAWVVRTEGARRAGWLGAIALGAAIVLAIGADRMAGSAAGGESHHTHAFDQWGRAATGSSDLAAIFPLLRDRLGGYEAVSLGLLIAAGIAGVAARKLLGDRGTVAGFLASRPAPAPTPEDAGTAWSRPIPIRRLKQAAVVVGLALAVVLAYEFYPPPEATFAEIQVVRADLQDAVRRGSESESLREIGRWELLARKLPIGNTLRSGRLDRARRERADEVIYSLGVLRDSVARGRWEEAKTLLAYVQQAHEECRKSFR